MQSSSPPPRSHLPILLLSGLLVVTALTIAALTTPLYIESGHLVRSDPFSPIVTAKYTPFEFQFLGAKYFIKPDCTIDFDALGNISIFRNEDCSYWNGVRATLLAGGVLAFIALVFVTLTLSPTFAAKPSTRNGILGCRILAFITHVASIGTWVAFMKTQNTDKSVPFESSFILLIIVTVIELLLLIIVPYTSKGASQLDDDGMQMMTTAVYVSAS